MLFFLLSINLFSQNIDKPNMSLRELKQNFDITQLSDSLMDSFTIEKSTKILKNLDAKIDDYTIINQSDIACLTAVVEELVSVESNPVFTFSKIDDPMESELD